MANFQISSCRRFRALHTAWLDLELELDQAIAMERHTGDCRACSALDTGVRRALLVARNVPELRPSAGFSSSLEKRLVAEALAQRLAASRHRPPTARAVGVLAAGLLALAWLAERRPPVGLPRAEVAVIIGVPDIPAVELPQPTVRSAPIGGPSAVRVVSVRRTTEPEWAPAAFSGRAGATPPLVAVNYSIASAR